MDDDAVSVQSQETDKQLDTPSSNSKTSIDSKESTPIPSDKEVDVIKDNKENQPENQEKKVSDLLYF